MNTPIAARQGTPFRRRRRSQAVNIRSAEDVRRELERRESEAHFQQWVMDQARLFGWMAYHTFDSRRSPEGFPDLILVRGDRCIAAEVKTETGKLTPAQELWLAVLDLVPGITTRVWRPTDRPAITLLLSRRTSF